MFCFANSEGLESAGRLKGKLPPMFLKKAMHGAESWNARIYQQVIVLLHFIENAQVTARCLPGHPEPEHHQVRL